MLVMVRSSEVVVSTWAHNEFTGNLHLNVIAKHGYSPEIEAALEPFIYELIGMLQLIAVLENRTNQMVRSISQGIRLGRTWNWFHENTRTSLFEERHKHRMDAENQTSV